MKKFTTLIFLVVCFFFLMLAVGGDKSVAARLVFLLLSFGAVFSALYIHFEMEKK